MLLAVTSIVIDNIGSIKVEKTTPQFSPKDETSILKTNIGLSHYSCSNACLQDSCKKSESFEGDGKYYCVCSDCKSINKCILTSNSRNSFTWTC